MQFDIQRFNKTVADAKAKAPQMAHKIDAAAENLLVNPFIADVDGGLLILSENNDGGNIYFAKSRGNVCNCRAHSFHQLCWHRIADALVRHYKAGRGH